MEPDVAKAEMILPNVLPFKRVQRTSEKHIKGQPKTKHWKHLKQIIQAENFQDYPSDQSNYVNIETPPSMYPPKKYCDITGFQTTYIDPKTNLRFANTDVFKQSRHLPEEMVQKYLSLRNAAVVLR
ncbi:INO80 complex subunit C [Zostera marina]|uniref:INO80 complex subunit C n=1 Tax=Zostera marina TaxID=29655 RepID=A0A0K9Q5Z3_ZOSMR|nr:INO80 complex subunit C [Zostera marina]